jgi:hypothetical protein
VPVERLDAAELVFSHAGTTIELHLSTTAPRYAWNNLP